MTECRNTTKIKKTKRDADPVENKSFAVLRWRPHSGPETSPMTDETTLHTLLDELDQRNVARRIETLPEDLANQARAIYQAEGRTVNEDDLAIALANCLGTDNNQTLATSPRMSAREKAKRHRSLRRMHLRRALSRHLDKSVGIIAREMGWMISRIIQVVVFSGLLIGAGWTVHTFSKSLQVQKRADEQSTHHFETLIQNALPGTIEALKASKPDYDQLQKLTYTELDHGFYDAQLQRRQKDGRPRIVLKVSYENLPIAVGSCQGVLTYFQVHPDQIQSIHLKINESSILNGSELNQYTCQSDINKEDINSFVMGPTDGS